MGSADAWWLYLLLLNKCEKMTERKSKKRSFEHFGPMLGLCCVSYSYSSPHSIAIRRIDPQLPQLPRSTLGIAAFRTVIEYEYRCTEYE